MSERRDLDIITSLVPRGSRVLDLGCGTGEVLAHLTRHHGCSGYGIEIDDANVLASTQRGVNVIQLNLEEGLALFDDRSFDVVLQLDTLQHLRNTERMLRETARVGRIGIVSFPNFAHWPVRWQLFSRRRMPKTGKLPDEWYETLNIHLTTIFDFREFCHKAGLNIRQEIPLRTSGPGRRSVVRFLPNLRADSAIFVLEAGPMMTAGPAPAH